MSTVGTGQVALAKRHLKHAGKEKENLKIILILHENGCTVSH